MARRRHTRRRRPHRSFGVLYKLISAVMISAAIVAALTLFFKVNEISITGVTNYSSEEILQASGVNIGDNLFLLNKYEISDSIIAKLPYVSSVSIRRKLPDTLVIEVTDSNQGGVIALGNEYWVVSSAGRLLGKRTEAGSGALIQGITLQSPKEGGMLSFAEGQERQLSQLLDLFSALEEKGMMQGVSAINFSDEGNISMEYAQQYTVKFPYSGDFSERLTVLNQVIDLLAQQEDTRAGTIDLSGRVGDKVYFIPR